MNNYKYCTLKFCVKIVKALSRYFLTLAPRSRLFWSKKHISTAFNLDDFPPNFQMIPVLINPDLSRKKSLYALRTDHDGRLRVLLRKEL